MAWCEWGDGGWWLALWQQVRAAEEAVRDERAATARVLGGGGGWRGGPTVSDDPLVEAPDGG